MNPDAGRVIKGKLVLESGNTMEASCHHRNGSACCGCYARLHEALCQIYKLDGPGPAREIVARVFAQMKADAE